MTAILLRWPFPAAFLNTLLVDDIYHLFDSVLGEEISTSTSFVPECCHFGTVLLGALVVQSRDHSGHSMIGTYLLSSDTCEPEDGHLNTTFPAAPGATGIHDPAQTAIRAVFLSCAACVTWRRKAPLPNGNSSSQSSAVCLKQSYLGLQLGSKVCPWRPWAPFSAATLLAPNSHSQRPDRNVCEVKPQSPFYR